MIELTAAKARLYEYMKTGKYSYKQLSEGTGMPYSTIKTYMGQFQKMGLAIRHGIYMNYVYTAELLEYRLTDPEREYIPKVIDEKQLSGPTRPVVHLTPDQEFYLVNHLRFEPRSKLAKKLGMPKHLLNYYLDDLHLRRLEGSA